LTEIGVAERIAAAMAVVPIKANLRMAAPGKCDHLLNHDAPIARLIKINAS
jgi:hypothetical protein